MSEDKREKPRVEFHTRADLIVSGGEHSCEISNLSMKGVFLVTSQKFAIGDRVELKINLSGSTTKLVIDITGNVERIDSNGVGIKFIEMELDSFIHLRNIVFYADNELHEFYEFM